MQVNELIDLLEQVFLNWWWAIVFVSALLEMSPLGWVMPGGMLVVVSAFFAWGSPNLLIGIIILSTLGGVTSFSIAYYLGQKTGNSFVKKLHQEKVAKRAEKILNNNGPVVLTTSMMAGIIRFWAAYVAGSQKYSFWKFIKYATISSFTWTCVIAIVGYIAGSSREVLQHSLAALGILSWMLVALSIAVIVISAKRERQEIEQ